MAAEDVARFEGTWKRYPSVAALAGLDLAVRRGEVLGLLGPNGAGKTTSLRVLLGLVRATAGRVVAFGFDCWSQSIEVRERTGYLPGDLRLWPELRPLETADLLGRFHADYDRPYARSLLAEMSVPDRAARELSRGNRQKVGLVLALCHRPELLVLDEPGSGLDPDMHEIILEHVRQACHGGATVLLSSHDLSEVSRVADRVAVIRSGRIAALEDVEALRRRAPRRVELRASRPLTAEDLRLDGVTVEHADGARVLLTYSGRPAELLARLSRLPLEDVRIGELDLEEALRQLYGTGGEARS